MVRLQGGKIRLKISFYKKTFLFWLLIFLVGLVIFWFAKSQVFKAIPQETAQLPLPSSGTKVLVVIQDNGGVLVNGEKASGLLKPELKKDLFHFKVVDNPGYFISSLTVDLKLPFDGSDKVSPRIFAIRGVGKADFQIIDKRTIRYRALDISPFALVTTEADLPKGMINFPFYWKFSTTLSSFSPAFWFTTSLAVPGLSLLIVSILFLWKIKASAIQVPHSERQSPPEALAPAAAGVLVKGSVGPREIAAMLIDLARRGFITIIQKKDSFAIIKKKNLDFTNPTIVGLTLPEAVLLSKILRQQKPRAEEKDIFFRIGHRIFSRKIAQVYFALYDEVTHRGYFIQNPGLVNSRFKLLGIIIFLLGFLFFLISLIFSPIKAFLWFWVGMMLVGLVIIRLVPILPFRTPKGKLALMEWLKFRNYLNSPKPMAYQVDLDLLYQKYLPFAIALGVEEQWSQRFTHNRFTMPDWYSKDRPIYTVEDFGNNLFPLIGFLSHLLAEAREPLSE